MSRVILACVVVIGISAAALAADEVKLERKYVSGTSATTHVEHTSRQKLIIAGQDIDTVSTRFVIITTKVGDRKDDGTLPMPGQIDKLQVELKLPGGITLPFDSGDPNKTSDNAALEPILAVLRVVARTKWTTLLDKDDKIQGFEYEGNPAESVDEQFKSQLDPAKRKQLAIREQGIIPDKAVKMGDAWTNPTEHDLGAGQTLAFDTRYEYLGTEEQEGKTLDKIGVKVTNVSYTVDPNANTPFKVKDAALKIESSEGTIYFSRERGTVTKSMSNTAIVGTLTVVINGMDLPSKLELRIEDKTTLQP